MSNEEMRSIALQRIHVSDSHSDVLNMMTVLTSERSDFYMKNIDQQSLMRSENKFKLSLVFNPEDEGLSFLLQHKNSKGQWECDETSLIPLKGMRNPNGKWDESFKQEVIKKIHSMLSSEKGKSDLLKKEVDSALERVDDMFVDLHTKLLAPVTITVQGEYDSPNAAAVVEEHKPATENPMNEYVSVLDLRIRELGMSERITNASSSVTTSVLSSERITAPATYLPRSRRVVDGRSSSNQTNEGPSFDRKNKPKDPPPVRRDKKPGNM
jgi:hypothetical protein